MTFIKVYCHDANIDNMVKIKTSQLHVCRICGTDYSNENYYPWGIDGDCPTHDICDCCGVEFGYEDQHYRAIINYRDTWIKNGANWFSPEMMPEGWAVDEIYKSIPKPFL